MTTRHGAISTITIWLSIAIILTFGVFRLNWSEGSGLSVLLMIVALICWVLDSHFGNCLWPETVGEKRCNCFDIRATETDMIGRNWVAGLSAESSTAILNGIE